MTEWRWTDDRGVQRLVSTEELRTALASNVLAPSTLVWREGMNEWSPASTLPELSADAPIPPKPSADASRPLRSRATPPPPPPPPPPRGTIPTLVGMPTPENDRNAPPASLAIVVPTPGNTPEPGRAVITQIPRYGTGTEPEGGAPDIPKAPRLPAPSGVKERPRPQRKVTTSEIDGLWAVPSSDTDDDYTLPLDSSSTPADTPGGGLTPTDSSAGGPGAASSPVGSGPMSSPAGGPVTIAYPVGGPGAQLAAKPAAPQPVPVRTVNVKPAPAPADNGKPRPDATPAPGVNKPSTGSLDADATLLMPPKAAAEVSGKGPEAAGAPRETGMVAEASAPKLGSVRPIPFGKPRELTGGKAPTHRPPPPPPPRPIKPPHSKLPPPLPPKRSSLPPAPEGGAPAKLGPLPPPPPLPRSTRPPRPPRREDAAIVAPIPPLRVPTIPLEDAPAPASADAETSSPALPPLPKQAEARQAADATDKPAASPSPLPAAPATAITVAATEPSEELSLETIEPEFVRSPGAGERSPLPLPETNARPSPKPSPESATRVEPIAAADGAEEPPPEPAKQIDAKQIDKPVSVPVSSLLGAGGALIFMVISAFFVGRCSAKTPPLVAQPGLRVIPAIVRATLPAPPKPCWVVRQPVMWAPMASKSIPFDVVATAQGSLAIGYARDENNAIGIEVTPATGQLQPRFEQRAKSDIERVTPMSSAAFQVITQDSGGALTSAVPVPAATPFFIGIQDGSLAIADRPDSAPTALWPLSGQEGISAARVQFARDQGYGLTFRREGAIWSGWLGPDRKPAGNLSRVPGSGGAVGKPNSGWNRREFAVIFADRPEGSDRWEIRVGHAPTGQIPSATSVIPLPKGGPGGDAFAPDIAGLPDGRWLLVWTEGPAGSRAIRAQTFAHDFTPVGDPIALSPPAGNFGQGVLGVVDNYAGAVFLSKGASNYELWGSILQCG